MVTIRTERTGDCPAIRRVLEQAFGKPDEADLVDALRRRDAVILSLVATVDDQVVGHILFTPVTIEGEGSSFHAVGLGPMAVLPPYQNKGVGSKLVCDGLQKCGEAGHEIVVVVGHPNYYPRFGFTSAKSRGIQWEFDVPDEVFMVIELREGGLAGRKGVVRYQPEFSSV
jgi:putative acetyltransferase